MTEEEIKNLKPGDKFTVEYTVVSCNEHTIDAAYANGEYSLPWAWESTFVKTATLAQPSPTFEVGDTVRIVPDPLTDTVHGNGRDKQYFKGEVREIVNKLDGGDFLTKDKDGDRAWINIHCLELVKKAVKDKYKIQDLIHDVNVVYQEHPDSVALRIAVSFNKGNHPNAEAAAKAECDRLNAEWRKQNEFS